MLNSIIRNTAICLASVLLAFAYNMFILPMDIQNGGLTGVAMIISHVALKFIGPTSPLTNTGMVILALNIPVFILGFVRLGKKFVARSAFSVVVTSLAMQWIPVRAVTSDPILAAVFGGVIVGACIGIVLKLGGSTGGFDIIGVVITQRRQFPLGELIFGLNAVVVVLSGFTANWNTALYTMLVIFVSGKVIDMLHTRHIKLTLMIITTQGELMRQRLLDELYRGVTVLDVEGGYSHKKRKMLMMVISHYELSDVKRVIREADPTAFVNIVQTREVMGLFYKDSPFKHPEEHRNDLEALPDENHLSSGGNTSDSNARSDNP